MLSTVRMNVSVAFGEKDPDLIIRIWYHLNSSGDIRILVSRLSLMALFA